MHPVQKHLFETNFRDLAGSQLEGTIALSDDLINLGLGELLLQLKPKAASKTESTLASSSSPNTLPSPTELLGLLEIEKLHYRTEEGKTILEIKAGLKK